MSAEPLATALFFAAFATLLGVSVLSSRVSQRLQVPVALVFLLIGVAAGSEGIGGIPFADYPFAFRLGSAALVLILFDGGLNTPRDVLGNSLRPAAVLATVGVVGTAAIVALAAHVLGLPWPAALLLGAVVSSTDAAAVFSVLRGSGIQLKRRVGGTLEVESGINDPVAVILTTILTQNLLKPGGSLAWEIGGEIVAEIAIGAAVGIAIGRGGGWLLGRARLPAGGLYPVLTLAMAFLAFGVAALTHGSGFLAVYIVGVFLGNGALPYRVGIIRVHDAMAWLSQVAMFLMLGLLVVPSHLREVAGVGLAIAIFLAVVARPAVVALCLLPFRYTPRDVLYVGWVGLRGAVPVILAIYPVLRGAPGAERLFNLVFFIVGVNALLPGATVPWVTRRLGLESADPPSPPAVLEVTSMQPLDGELMSFYVDEALAVAGVMLSDLPFPDGASAAMIVRGNQMLAAKGNTCLEPGDHVYVFSRSEDVPMIRLMFGRPEGD
ncbi:MAG: potassium/proton antiporter [Gemmatimonadaceae bacterium]